MDKETLKGRNILVAEDEYHIADDLRSNLEALGATVVGPVASVQGLRDLVESAGDLDGAILDVNLRGEMVFDAADRLRERGVPFIFSTGYDESAIPARFSDVIRCEKPISLGKIMQAMAKIIPAGVGGA